MNHRSNCPSSHHSRPSSKNQSFSYPTNRTYREDDDCDDDEYVAEAHESDNNEDSDDAYHTIGESKNSSFGHPKKRRLDSYNVGYEYASRSASNSQRIWTEHSTCALLEIWGRGFSSWVGAV
ncbi:hypothetical protein Nepgr_025645 [Nepenthes gracilis]|uniref:Uncharacterized protein n=1 Tax=Nepenthes gracilis TaxID=150966 RepID=A0AAD3XZP8_NEPGR|nr:hypothetical protein Nepgr_025645 [Nepenthes gracilis]